jgi:branched-chain amino acid transport system permease protein
LDSTIVAFLVQDGVINGAIYALLAVALVLVFTVTRVILVPQGDFVTFGGLTLAALETGRTPPAIWLLLVLAIIATAMDAIAALREGHPRKAALASFAGLAPALLIIGVVLLVAPLQLGLAVNLILCTLIIVPMGPYLYRAAFQPLANASVLVLLIAAVGAHLGMTGLGLAIFGAEGFRTSQLIGGSFELGPLTVTGQTVLVLIASAGLLVALSFFFGSTLLGKALRASAVNQRGARLVGISPSLSGKLAFTMAAAIGVVSAVLIAPLTTLYYDSGFLIGLKGFVAAIIGGLASYPGAVLAALGVGMLESFSSFWASAFKEVIVFAAILPVLLLRSLTAGHVEEEEH